MIRYFASHPTAANLLMVLLLVSGLASAPGLKRETFPDIPPDEVEVRIEYPGAGTEDVEEAICQRLEDTLDSVTDKNEVRCEAREGIGVAVIEMREGADFDRFLSDIKTEVEAIDDFPEDTKLPVIRQLGRTDFVVAVAITGDMAAPDLKDYAEQIKDRLLALDEISQVTVTGFSDRQFRVEIPAHTLQQYGLSLADVAAVVGRQSVDLPAGLLQTGARDLLLRFTDQRRTVQELEDLVVVAGAAGAEVRLGDIARVTDRFELDEDKVQFNGRRAAVLEVTKTKAEDSLRVIGAVEAFLARERQAAPPGVTFALTRNLSSIVRDRLNLLLRNGGQGIILVFLTLWLFFTLRFSFWVAMGLPVSFLGALFAMSVLGYSLNMITMVGLLIAVGLLMDDAIVISENIAAHMAAGKAPLEAAVDGTREVFPSVLSSFLTTVCVLGSLAFLKGDIGNILKALPVVLAFTLLVSLIEAFFILPHHLGRSLEHARKRPVPWFRLRFEKGFEWARSKLVGTLVKAAVDWRYLFIGFVIVGFLLSIGLLADGTLKFRAFPDVDGDVIDARVLMPQGTPLERMEAVVDRVVRALDRVNAEFRPLQPGGQPLVRQVNVQFNRNVDAYETGPHVATVTADLLNAESRNARLEDVLNRWREAVGSLPDVLNVSYKEPVPGPAGLALDIRLQGRDLAELKAASLELQAWLNSYTGVVDLTDDLRPGKPEIRLRLREGAYVLGLSAAEIARQVRAAFHGSTAEEIQVGPEAYEIDVRLSPAERNSLADLEYFYVTSATGRQIPLASVAALENARGYARINRVNGRRTVTVQGDVYTRVANVNEIVQDTRSRFLEGLSRRHPGVRVSFEGQAGESRKTGDSLRRGFLLGLLGVFVILSFQFKSYLEPVVVMVAIPLGLIGVIWGHRLMGLELSMPSVLGYVSLAGVLVNNSILLIQFAKEEAGRGRAVREAVQTASRARFRAILLTSLTTIMGLLPLLTERSLQAQVLIPLATSLVFGLLASAVLVLFVIPALYAILDDWGLTALSRRR